MDTTQCLGGLRPDERMGGSKNESAVVGIMIHLNAFEARERSIRSTNEPAAEIMNRIKVAAESGQFSLLIGEDRNGTVFKKLNDAGYTVCWVGNEYEVEWGRISSMRLHDNISYHATTAIRAACNFRLGKLSLEETEKGKKVLVEVYEAIERIIEAGITTEMEVDAVYSPYVKYTLRRACYRVDYNDQLGHYYISWGDAIRVSDI